MIKGEKEKEKERYETRKKGVGGWGGVIIFVGEEEKREIAQ